MARKPLAERQAERKANRNGASSPPVGGEGLALVNEILDGSHDALLDEVVDAVRERKRSLRDREKASVGATLRRALAEAEPDENGRRRVRARIRHDASLRPKYLLGQECWVDAVERTRADIVFDHDVGRYRSGGPIRCPLDALELV